MLDMKPRPPVPVEDPVPSLTERYRSTGALNRDSLDVLLDTAIASMRGTIQSVVTGLSTDEKPFRVIFGKTSSAATDLKGRLVYVGTKAMTDRTLSDGRLAAVMTGLAYHEVAHINYDRSYEAFVTEQVKGHPVAHLVHDVHNIGQDVRIEARIARDMPGYADTLESVLWYMTEESGAKAPAPKTAAVSPSVARNVFYAAVRAPWIIRDWTGYEAERQWGHDWAQRIAATDKRQTIADLIKEALDRIALWSAGHVAPPSREATPEEEQEDEEREKQDSDDFTHEPDEIVTSSKEDEDKTSSPPSEPEPTEPEPTGEPEEGEPDEEAEGEPTEGEPTPGDTEDAAIESDEGEGGEPAERGGWSDTDGEAMASELHETPATSESAPSEVTETTAGDIEDLEYPACAADALRGAADSTFQNIAMRVEKSREEATIRIIRTPGWKDRKVVRRWDWNDTPPQS